MKKLMTSDKTSYEDALMCPNCEDVWVHITKVEILTGKYGLVVNSNGIKTTSEANKEAVGNRGAIVKLFIACEICGHVGSIDFSFHKGMTYVNCVDQGEENEWCDLWRD